MTAEDTAELKGIKGWLALLALYQILTVIKVTITYAQGLDAYLAPLNVPGPRLVDYAQLGVTSLIIPMVYATLITLLARKRSFKVFLQCQWLGNPGLIALNMIVKSFIVTGIWVAYARTSRRVANTMVNRGAAPLLQR